jgi:predicted N-acetyltransferase YhbS
VPEAALSKTGRAEIREFLVAAYAPRFVEVFSRHDFWGGPAEARVLVRTTGGALVAHCGFAPRRVRAGEREVRIAGIGAVATAPTLRGEGLGRRMFEALFARLKQTDAADFAFLECGDPVVGFYERCGFAHSVATVSAIEPATCALDVSTSNVMTRPIGDREWPEGPIELRGMRW